MTKYKGIMPAFIHPPSGVPQTFMRSMHNSYRAGVFQHDWTAGVGSRPNAARTQNGNNFLASSAEYIMLLDTDMVWEPDAIIKLKQTADERNAGGAAGWAVMLKQGIWPNAYEWNPDAPGYVQMGRRIPPFSVPTKVDAVGGSCFLVHRDVYVDVEEAVRGTTANPWQDDVYVPEMEYQMGEDICFSHRIRTFTDHEIWYVPDAIFTHIKATPYGPREYERYQQRLQEKINANLRRTHIQPTSPKQAG